MHASEPIAAPSASDRKNVLDGIMAYKREEVALRKQAFPLKDWMETVNPCPPRQLEAAFRRTDRNVRLMLEIKPASPSEGVMASTLDLDAIVEAYQRYGVAISVLTDKRFFGGSLELLASVTEKAACPVLCKEFIFDPYQIYEARRAGAAAILLIVKALEDAQLSELSETAISLGMTPLVEVQDQAETARALSFQPRPGILLINNRNLQTLEMDLSTTPRLSSLIPSDVLRVSASGVKTVADIARLKPDCDGFLIGSALMRRPVEELAATLAEWHHV